jgi:protein arginine N-methyltransferase 1
MLADRIRMDSFVQAMRGAVRPGDVVMDIGTGPGNMAILACQLGAKHVYAIEPSEVIQVAREIAAANGYGDKIEFFEDVSTKVTIPTRVNVIISDLRGVLPLYEQHIPSIVDARQRFLAPGGKLIARKDRIWAAVVEAPETFGKIVDVWDKNSLGQDLGVARSRVLNEYRKVRVKPEQLLTPPQHWATLDYLTVENPDVSGTLQWTVERNGTGHGVLVWFEMELADGVGFSNGPESPETVYGTGFFPWTDPMNLAAGQNVRVDLEAKLLEQDYFWRWTTHIESAAKPGEIVTRINQSQLQGSVLSVTKLRKSASNFVPQLSEEGAMRRRTLELMDGKSSLEKIARRLAAEFPDHFSDWRQGLSFAAAISKENSR